MQAQVYLQPLANSTGAFQPRERIHPMSGMRVASRLEKNKWSHGVLASGSVKLSLDNFEGRYGSSCRPSSVFALAGADGAKVEIEYPTARDGSTYAVVWRGLLTSKGMQDGVDAGIASWTARTPDAVLREARLNAGAIAVGQTLAQALEAVFRQADVAAAMPSVSIAAGLDPNPAAAGYTAVQDEGELLGDERAVLRALQRLLMLADATMVQDLPGDAWTIGRRGATGISIGTLREVVKVEDIEDGSEQVYNQVLVETGVAGEETYEARSEGSIARWGLRALKLDLKWMRHLENAARIADFLLARLQAAKRCVSLKVDGWALPPGSLAVGSRLEVDVPALVPAGSSRTGTARTGAAQTARATYPKIQGSFYVEEIIRDLDYDLVQLRLRERIL